MTISDFENKLKEFFGDSEILYPGNTPIEFRVIEDESIVWELEEKMHFEELKFVDGKICFYFRIIDEPNY